MSILNRPGWANRKLINEGRVYQDELKRRILNLFDRPSLGRSPNYVVDNIYDTLRSQNNNEDFDTSSINDDDIIKITIDTAQNISRGQCKPQLKIEISTVSGEEESEMDHEEEHEDPIQAAMMFGTEQPVKAETEEEAPEARGSEEYQEMESEEPEENEEYEENEENEEDEEDEESIDMNSEESAEQVKTCKCAETQSIGSVGSPNAQPKRKTEPVKETVKLSPSAVNQLLKENYIKSRQHKFSVEEKYRF